MALGDYMESNQWNSAKGMFADGTDCKAIIYIPNIEKYDPDKVTDETALNTSAQQFENDLYTKAKKGPVESKLSENATKIAREKSGNATHVPVGEVAPENKDFYKIVVQFNPASIKMDSVNGTVKHMNNASVDSAKILQQQEYNGKTKISFDLVFDDLDLMDAFMLQEVVDFNLTKGVGKAANMISRRGNTFSVRQRMELFLALLSATCTQQVIFFWGRMVFRGQVTGVTNTYTMFNTKGNPIRGTMHLEITQDDKKSDKYNYTNESWKDSFNNTFVGGKGGGTSMASKVFNNNILNF